MPTQKVRLKKNSDYHRALIKQYGAREAEKMLGRISHNAWNFGEDARRKIADYARAHLQHR